MAIPIYGMADHQVALYEKKDTEVDDSGVSIFSDFFKVTSNLTFYIFCLMHFPTL